MARTGVIDPVADKLYQWDDFIVTKFEEDEVGGTCGTNGGEEERV
jgi:hypothetical protein